jgi:hypothetical protein
MQPSLKSYLIRFVLLLIVVRLTSKALEVNCLFFFSCNVNATSEMMFFKLQLKLCKGISYAAVAAHADRSGRRKLAAMLVDHEPHSSKQVFFF